MKYQVLISLTNNKNVFETVVCCSRDWCLKEYGYNFRESTPPLLFLPPLSIGVNFYGAEFALPEAYSTL